MELLRLLPKGYQVILPEIQKALVAMVDIDAASVESLARRLNDLIDRQGVDPAALETAVEHIFVVVMTAMAVEMEGRTPAFKEVIKKNLQAARDIVDRLAPLN